MPAKLIAMWKKIGIGLVSRMVKIKSIERVGLYLVKTRRSSKRLYLVRYMNERKTSATETVIRILRYWAPYF
jgi:hypothetical protein